MARKKGSKSLTPKQKKEIIITHASNESISETAKKFNLSESTIFNVVRKNIGLSREISDNLNQSMMVGAGKVGNLAIDALEKKNLNKEKASTCSQIASDMSKIIRGDQPSMVQVNVTMPRSRAELISFLDSKQVDNTIVSESANIEQDKTITQSEAIQGNDKTLESEHE